MSLIEAERAFGMDRVLPRGEFNVAVASHVLPQAYGEGFSDEVILGGYYTAVKPNGGHSHAEGIAEVASRVHSIVGGERKLIKHVVDRGFTNTVGPEYLNPAALPLVYGALQLGDVHIWTVGDHGEGSSYYQQHKIDESRLTESVGSLCIDSGIDPAIVQERMHVQIYPSNKIEGFFDTLREAQLKGGKIAAIVADDKPDNINRAKQKAASMGVPCYDWIVKGKDDHQGNLAKFWSTMVEEAKKLKALGIRPHWFLDFDDTLSDEMQRMRDAGKFIYQVLMQLKLHTYR